MKRVRGRGVIFGLPVVISTLVSGCAALNSPQPISTSRIVEVVDDAKRQVSIYMSYQNSHRIVSKTRHCGNALIDFDIKQVKLDLLSTFDATAEGGISAEGIPVSYIPVGFTLTGSIEGTNTQELIFVAEPLANPNFVYIPSKDEAPAPLAVTMASLREGLIRESDKPNRVCFRTVKGGGDESSNSFKYAVTVVTDASGKLTLGLAPLTLSASGETKSTTGNTITFTFAPHKFGPGSGI